MILVVGANGRVGTRLVHELGRIGEPVRALVRDAAKARERFDADVEIAVGELGDTQSLVTAMADVDGIFLCSPVHPDQATLQNGVIDVAVQIGRPYVVKLSGLGTFADSYVNSGKWHAETEAHLAASGLPFTCLHPYFFMQNLAFQLPRIRSSGELYSAVTEAPIAMVDADDIAAVAARLLIRPNLAPGETLPLTASESLSYEQIAERMTEVLGRSVVFKPQTQGEVADNLRKAGQPEWHIEILLQFNRAFNAGLAAVPHPAVEKILARPAKTLDQFLIGAEKDLQGRNPFPS